MIHVLVHQGRTIGYHAEKDRAALAGTKMLINNARGTPACQWRNDRLFQQRGGVWYFSGWEILKIPKCR